jgi:pilus assembly protein Flp/PilA
MTKLIAKAHTALIRFTSDKAGAALVEYSLLIGFISVVVVAMLLLISPWISLQWTNLADALGLT